MKMVSVVYFIVEKIEQPMVQSCPGEIYEVLKLRRYTFIISAELHQIDSEHLIVPCHVYGVCVCVCFCACEVSYFKNHTQVPLCPKPKSSKIGRAHV